jgi:hypothetical protein
MFIVPLGITPKVNQMLRRNIGTNKKSYSKINKELRLSNEIKLDEKADISPTLQLPLDTFESKSMLQRSGFIASL